MAQRTSAGRSRPKAWSYVAGKRGRNRVRVYDRPGHGLWIDYKDDAGRRVRQSLGMGDDERERAEAEADRIAAQFRREGARDQRGITLRTLFDRYEREKPKKGTSKQGHDERARKLFLACWGADTPIAELDRRDWDRFIEQRRSGALRPEGRASRTADDGVRIPASVGPRVIQYDLRFVLATLRWGESVRDRGRPLVERNPFRGFPLPSEPSPRRPAVSAAEYEQLVQVAPRVSRSCALFLMLANETGHRGASLTRLRWSDVDLTAGMARWPAEFDKMRARHDTPLSRACVEALKEVQRECGAIGDAWIFPAPGEPAPGEAAKPISRHLVRDWWVRLETLAKLPAVQGRGWHSLRRKFASEHQDLPLVELMALGGWRDPQTLVKCYQKPREDRLREAVERRSASNRHTQQAHG